MSSMPSPSPQPDPLPAPAARIQTPPPAEGRSWQGRLWDLGVGSGRVVLQQLLPRSAPLDLQILGRTLFHTALVGLAAGLVGAAFFWSLEWMQEHLLLGLAGYSPLRAHGEQVVQTGEAKPFNYFWLALLPALGALASGLISELSIEARGGGGDAMIHAFHHNAGQIRPRVIPVKVLASLFTLGSGGSGGREGPTMLFGGAIGSTVGEWVKGSARERRVLMVAGVAAGISAVFRTPLGAALLAVECLYSDDFESEALVPAILASVISYSVVISFFGESTLFDRAARYPFVPGHLWLYGLLAVTVAGAARLFLRILRTTQALSQRLTVPVWARPAMGGLGLGLVGVVIVNLLQWWLGPTSHGLGVLGGGYGAAQLAITGGPPMPSGWTAVELLVLLACARMLAASLTIGTGGSAGDFAPSMVIGGLVGGAFGHAAALLLHDPRIDPGAFALVGMGTFYGGLAHVPVSSLILVSEMAGSYDLLVPLMLAEGIAFVMLRNHLLYGAQVRTQKDSPVHGVATDDVGARPVSAALTGRAFVTVSPADLGNGLLPQVDAEQGQSLFPVVEASGALRGLLLASAVRSLRSEPELLRWARVVDLMQPALSVSADEPLRQAASQMLAHGLRALPVVDAAGRVVGLLDEDDLARVLLAVPGEK